MGRPASGATGAKSTFLKPITVKPPVGHWGSSGKERQFSKLPHVTASGSWSVSLVSPADVKVALESLQEETPPEGADGWSVSLASPVTAVTSWETCQSEANKVGALLSPGIPV